MRHIVYTSFAGASPRSTFTLVQEHAAIEEPIRASGMSFTFLRDNLYADFLPRMVDDLGAIRGPAGEGRVAAVAQQDVADVAATVLLDPEPHVDVTYELSGPAALTLAEAAAVITGSPTRRWATNRDDRRGLPVSGRLRCAGLAGRGMGQHLYRHRCG